MEWPSIFGECEAGESKPRLVGIARLAAMSESVDEGHGVEYFGIPVRSLLNKCSAPRMPFGWTINPYRGCEFACKYCYARYAHEFMELRDNRDFERKIFVKQSAAWLLRQELAKVKSGEEIAIGTATDPYQPIERRQLVTRSIFETLSLFSGLSIGLVTKSKLVERDIDLFQKVSEQNSLHIFITVTTMDADLARKLEPRAPRPDLRMEAVHKLRQAGIKAGVLCAPVLPQITDHASNIEAVVRAAKEAGATHVSGNPLYLKPCSKSIFMPFLEEHFPHLVPIYQKRYGENAFVSKEYRKRIQKIIGTLCAKHKVGIRERRDRPVVAPRQHTRLNKQLALF
jgi:DNA repair photolyase